LTTSKKSSRLEDSEAAYYDSQVLQSQADVKLAQADASLREMELNVAHAEAHKFGAEQIQAEENAQLYRVQRELLEIQLKASIEKAALENAYDWKHGYVNFAEEIDAQSVLQLAGQLRKMSRLFPNMPFIIELNSPGGSIIDGFQLFDEIIRLRNEGHVVTIRVRGEAASMAAVILQAADKREIGPSAFIMIHRAAFGAKGKTFEVEDQVEVTKMLENRIYEILAERSGKEVKFWRDLLLSRKDLWYTAQESVSAGLVDRIN